MKGPSAHLSWDELGCKDGTPYPEQWRSNRARLLAEEFEKVREALGGKSLVVLSAYRTPEHNKSVGGAKNSQHVFGKALDIRTPRGWTPAKMAAKVRRLVDEGSRIRGLGIYSWGIHIDIRTAERLVVWSSATGRE